MKTTLSLILAALAAAIPAWAEESAGEAYARAVTKENAERDPEGAMAIYRNILKQWRAEEEVAAKAQFRIGECLEKTGDLQGARTAYDAVLRDFPNQVAVVEKARERLDALGQQGVTQKTPAEILDAKLATTKIDIDFTDSTLYDVVDFIQEFAKINSVVDGAAAEVAEAKRSVALKDLTLENVVKLLASTANLETVNHNGILVWTTIERAQLLKARPPIDIAASAPQEDQKVMRAVQSIRISLNFTDTPFTEVCSFIREVTQLNVVMVQGCPDPALTFRVSEAELTDALDMIGFLTDMKFEIHEGVLVVSPLK
ncbi:MAG: tetratricopeptide repeat protein [Planctomycetes bacterium]|nr:tetratricopeptide repeat protein [Planctomycetota bacterium]